MDGICAIFNPNEEHLIKKICKNLQHRGPDDEGYFFGKNIALAHRALKITKDNFVHQPYSNEDETIWISFDGEIYNKEHLIKKLEKDHIIKTNSCAEIVLHAYEDEDFNCINKFNGMFAFCLWDSINNWLFCARDRLGEKPLYYYKYQDSIIIASEIKGILADPSVPRKPNKNFIYEYIVSGARATRECSSRTEDTFFSGIKELLPAHYMIIDKTGIKIRKYWQPIKKLTSNHNRFNDHWCASEFRNLLRDSISIRLPNDLPVGTFLSGGLDSTSLAFLVEMIKKDSKNKNIKTHELFSAIYKGQIEQGDEKHYIKEVEQTIGKKINYIFPSVEGEWDNIKKFIYYIEEPVGVFNYYVYWYLFQNAKQKVKIIFHGQGPDEILGGHTEYLLIYFKELWDKKKIRTLVKELICSVDWTLPYMARSIWFRRNAQFRAKKLLAQNFVADYNKNQKSRGDISLQDTLLKDSTQLLAEHLRVEDRASSAFSIECRHPFLDHRIVEFVFSLPSNQKIRNGYTKYVLRKAMEGIIPEAIRKKRKKAATPIPFQNWLKTLRPNIRELFNSKKIQEQGYFNTDTILKIIDLYCDGKLSTVERLYYAGTLWRCINLALWLDIFSFNE